MNTYFERLYNGTVKENPTFVLMLGMCPTLAVTSSAINGLGMGLSTTVVLILANLLISVFRKVIPNGVRMPAYIVIVASLVTVVDFLMQAYLQSLSAALGVYIPLIVVNCIILGRAESYASKNPPVASIFDGLGMGLGFTIGLTCIGLIREVLGAGEGFGVALSSLPLIVKVVSLPIALILLILAVMSYRKKMNFRAPALLIAGLGIVIAIAGLIALLGKYFTPITIFIMAPGAFLVLAFLVAGMNLVRKELENIGKPLAKPAGCISGDCASCSQASHCTDAKKVIEENET